MVKSTNNKLIDEVSSKERKGGGGSGLSDWKKA